MRNVYAEMLQNCPSEEITLSPTNVYVGSSTPRSIASKEQLCARTKRTDLKIYHIREKVNEEIKLIKTASQKQPADMLAEVQSKAQLERCISMLSLNKVNTTWVQQRNYS